MVERLPSSLFFISAAVYLTIFGNLDIITVLAALACAVCTVLVIKEKVFLSITGGVGIISTSLALQVALNYRCSTCLKADVLVLLGILTLALLQGKEYKKLAISIAGIMTVVVMSAIILSTPLIGETNDQEVNFSRHITVSDTNGKDITIDTARTPALLFTPTCPACKDILQELISIDPNGSKWKAVLSTEQKEEMEKAEQLLKEYGFKGEIYIYDWHGIVPTLVFTEKGITDTGYSVKELKEKGFLVN